MKRDEMLERVQYGIGLIVAIACVIWGLNYIIPAMSISEGVQTLLFCVAVLGLIVISIIYFQRLRSMDALKSSDVYMNPILIVSILVQLVLVVIYYMLVLLPRVSTLSSDARFMINWIGFPLLTSLLLSSLNVILPSRYRIEELGRDLREQQNSEHQKIQHYLETEINKYVEASTGSDALQELVRNERMTTEEILLVMAYKFKHIGDILTFIMVDRYLELKADEIEKPHTLLREWGLRSFAFVIAAFEIILLVGRVIRLFSGE